MVKTIREENTDIKIAIIQTDIGYIKGKTEEINKKMDTVTSQFVSQTEFNPIKRLVYGLVGLILIAVVTAIFGMILQG